MLLRSRRQPAPAADPSRQLVLALGTVAGLPHELEDRLYTPFNPDSLADDGGRHLRPYLRTEVPRIETWAVGRCAERRWAGRSMGLGSWEDGCWSWPAPAVWWLRG